MFAKKLFRRRGQAATEYILLVALGLVIVVVGIALAFQVKGFTDAIATRIADERNALIAMVLR